MPVDVHGAAKRGAVCCNFTDRCAAHRKDATAYDTLVFITPQISLCHQEDTGHGLPQIDKHVDVRGLALKVATPALLRTSEGSELANAVHTRPLLHYYPYVGDVTAVADYIRAGGNLYTHDNEGNPPLHVVSLLNLQ